MTNTVAPAGQAAVTPPSPYDFSLSDYRYSKSQPHCVRCPSQDKYSTAAATIARTSGGRWVHRAGGYLMSDRQLEKFKSSIEEYSKAYAARQVLARVAVEQSPTKNMSVSA